MENDAKRIFYPKAPLDGCQGLNYNWPDWVFYLAIVIKTAAGKGRILLRLRQRLFIFPWKIILF